MSPGMRHTIAVLFLSLVSLNCVSAPEGAAAAQTVDQASVTVTAAGISWLIPPSTPSPGFADLEVDVMSVASLATPGTDIAASGNASLGHIPLQSASASCEVAGCQWHLPDVLIAPTSGGLMSLLSDTRASGAVWHDTYALMVNPNQILDSVRLGSPISAFAPSYVLANTGIDKLAALLSTDANALLAKGLCLGLVWSGRGEGTGIAPGFAGATIEATTASGTALDVYYFNDAMTQLSTSGTNQAGLFVLVGQSAAADGNQTVETPSTYSVALTISRAQSAGNYQDNVAIVRPGVVTVMPMIPRR